METGAPPGRPQKRMNITSTYEGPVRHHKQVLHKISHRGEFERLKPWDESGFHIEPEERENVGTTYFDNDVGRLVEREVRQSMRLVATRDGHQGEQRSTTTTKVTVTARTDNGGKKL